MSRPIYIRPIREIDSPALQALVESTPSTGSISFTYEYQADFLAVHRTISPELHGLVALDGSPDGVVIAAVFGDALTVQWNGENRQAGYIHNLRVHGAHRRQGIATRLRDHGLDYAAELLGPDVLLYSAIPEGNASMALVPEFDFHTTHAVQGGIVPMRKRPPKALPEITIRSVEPADLPALARGMNTFYRDHQLWSPVTPAGLTALAAQAAAGIHPTRCYVAEHAGEIVAGLSIADLTALVRMRIAGLPRYARALARWLGIFSPGGLLNALSVRRVWFHPGQLAAAQYLWETLRYQLRDEGSCLGIAYDPQDTLVSVFQVPRWLPMFKARYIVSGSEPPDSHRPVYCLAGP